jgi:hypothetical protein
LYITDLSRARVPRLVAVLALVAATAVAALPSPALADAASAGGDFVPLSGPAVVLDTRTGIGATTG